MRFRRTHRFSKVEKAPLQETAKTAALSVASNLQESQATSLWQTAQTKLARPFCQLHLDNNKLSLSLYLKTKMRLDLFKKEHPGLFKRSWKAKLSFFYTYSQKPTRLAYLKQFERWEGMVGLTAEANSLESSLMSSQVQSLQL